MLDSRIGVSRIAGSRFSGSLGFATIREKAKIASRSDGVSRVRDHFPLFRNSSNSPHGRQFTTFPFPAHARLA